MPESLSERIERFYSYFLSHISAVSKLEGPDHVFHYRRILFVSILDALSKVPVPRRESQNRMVSFIREFSGWQESEKVSLPHLLKRLSLSPEPQFESLRTHARELFRSWQPGDVIGLDRDPSFEEIQSLWPREQDRPVPIEGKTLEDLQHGRLFYNHRNSLVHEFRMPGLLSFAPSWTRERPYYSVLLLDDGNLEQREISWALQYPASFYEAITTHSLEALRACLQKNSLDPISFFKSGPYWIEGLN